MRVYELLLVEDNSSLLDLLRRTFTGKGYRVTTASSGEDALNVLNSKPFDLIITDLYMYRVDGLAVLKKAKELNPETMVILLTGDHDVKVAVDALRLDADDYLLKPFNPAELWERVTACIDKLECRRKNTQCEENLREMNEKILNMLRIMCHDIRGSLVSVASALKLINRGYFGPLNDKVAHELNDLYGCVTGSVGMAEDFIGKTFSVSEEIEVEKETLDLKEDILDPLLAEFSSEIRKHSVVVDSQLDSFPGSRIPVNVSKVWLKAVFRNLLRNAIKYGGRGCTVSIGFKKNDSHYLMNVYNSGQPIPEECRDKIFSKFVHAAAGDNGNKEDGVGLGLYLIRNVIEKHGGSIWYEAREKGSNFVFTLPCPDQDDSLS